MYFKNKNKFKMETYKTKKISTYFIFLLVIAVILQLILLVYRIFKLYTT